MRNRIRTIVVLMIACILGIYCFQGYWLYRTYILQRDEFRKEINEALRTAVYNKQFNDVRKFIHFPFGDKDKDRDNDFRFGRTMPAAPPFDTIHALVPAVAATMVTDSNKNIIVYRNARVRGEGIEMSDSAILHIRQMGDARHIRAYSDSMARQISDFIILNDIYKDKLSVKKLDSVYKQELKSRNIATDYKLDTFQINPNAFARESFRDSFRIRDTYQTGKVSFNPFSNIFVQATFDPPVQYILGQMLWILVGSFILLLLTTTCFLYMMRTILKQKKLSEVKNDFINNMTHELKTPIATVYAAVEAMQNFNALNDQRKTQNYLDISKQELQRLSDLVEKVLHIAAEEKEDFDLFLEDVDLNELIENIITNHELKSTKPVNIHFEPLEDAVVVVDRTHLSNAISNLVDNAIKYSKEKADITVTLKRLEGRMMISVEDQGIGIPKLYRDNIFEKFFRVPTGNLHNVKGFGLGLSYVKKIVQKHEGIISVNSEPDKGSEFIIDIPA